MCKEWLMCLKSNFFAIKLFCNYHKHKGNDASIFLLPFKMPKKGLMQILNIYVQQRT